MNFPFRYGVNSLLLNDRGKAFLDSEFLLGVEPRSGLRRRRGAPQPAARRPRPLVRAATAPRPTGSTRCAGPHRRFTVHRHPGHPLLGDLRPRRRRRPRHRHQRVQLRAAGPGERPRAAPRPFAWLPGRSCAAPPRTATAWARGSRSTPAGRVLAQRARRQVGLPLAELLPLYFGLGDATRVDRVEVRWPSGKTQVERDVAIGTTVEVVED